ncbi:MAG: hypothetical protein LBT00_11790 [Spirochaetaceae bacterium]|nr:hypothetical protein [Spirochaetaceae bacterium]
MKNGAIHRHCLIHGFIIVQKGGKRNRTYKRFPHERSEAIQHECLPRLDCFVASLFAMTMVLASL